jgi:hypothetical protein
VSEFSARVHALTVGLIIVVRPEFDNRVGGLAKTRHAAN